MKTQMMSKTLTLAATLCLALTSPAAEPRKKTTTESKPAVTDIHYFPQSSVLRVELANGRTYHYENVPEALADQFAVSEQKREFLDREISRQYRSAPAAVADQPAAPTAPKDKTEGKAKSAKAKETATKAPVKPAPETAEAQPKAKAPARKAPETPGKSPAKFPMTST